MKKTMKWLISMTIAVMMLVGSAGIVFAAEEGASEMTVATPSPDTSPSASPSTSPTTAPKKISPIFEYTIDNGDGTFTAHFGYNNKNAFACTINVGPDNNFTGTMDGQQGQGQPTTFQPGRHRDVFTVVYNQDHLVWTLKGIDGKIRTATAGITASKTLTAIADPAAGGTISVSANKAQYVTGERIKLTAVAADGYRFIGWSGTEWKAGRLLKSKTVSVKMDKDETITAHFEKIYTFRVTPNSAIINGHVRVIYNGNVYDLPSGKTTTFEAEYKKGKIVDTIAFEGIADAGYAFNSWSCQPNHQYKPGSNGHCELSIFDYKGSFCPWPTFLECKYTLDVTVGPTGTGSVTVEPLKSEYSYGEVVTLTAVPGSVGGVPQHLEEWTGDATGSALATTVTMDANKSVTANFADNMTFVVKPSSSITNGKVRVLYGNIDELLSAGEKKTYYVQYDGSGNMIDEVAFEGIGDTDYAFYSWTWKPNHIYNDNVNGHRTRIISTDKDKKFTPNPIFKKVYALTVNVTPGSHGGMVIVDPEQTQFFEGDVVQLTAVPYVQSNKSIMYKFVEWTGDASGEAEVTSVTMDADKTVTANFRPQVVPSHEYTLDNGDGTYTAVFGYLVAGSEAVTLLAGTDANSFEYQGGDGLDMGQTQVFGPGRHYDIFGIDYDGSDLVWTLDGMTVTANSDIETLRFIVDPEDLAGGTMKVTNMNNGASINYDGTLFDGNMAVVHVAAMTNGSYTQMKFEAIPDAGYVFDEWSKYPGEANPRYITYDPAWQETSESIRRPEPLFGSETVTVSFVNDDSTPIDSQSIPFGMTAKQPDDPVKDGHTFAGWRLEGDDDTRTDSLTVVKENITATATYTINTYGVTFFDEDGTTELGADTADWNTAAARPANPQKEGHTFAGWSLSGDDDAQTDSLDNVRENIVATAMYTINTFTVTFFDDDGITLLGSDVADWNTAAVRPADPEKEGHTFAGWSLSGDDDTETDSLANVRENIVATATYTINTYTVTFVDDDGETVLGTDTVVYHGSADAPSVSDREGERFAGWDTDFGDVRGNLTVTAVYETILIDLSAFIIGSGSIDDEVAGEYAYGTVIDLSGVSVTPADGFEFAGWQDADGNPITSVVLTENTQVFAVFNELAAAVLTEEDVPEAGDNEPDNGIDDEQAPLSPAKPASALWWLLLILLIPILFLAIYRNVIVTYYDKDGGGENTRKRRALRRRGEDGQALMIELKDVKKETIVADVTIKKGLAKKIAKKQNKEVNAVIGGNIVKAGVVSEDIDGRFEMKDINV